MTASIRVAFSRRASAASVAWVCTPRPTTASSGWDDTTADPVTVTEWSNSCPGYEPQPPGNCMGHGGIVSGSNPTGRAGSAMPGFEIPIVPPELPEVPPPAPVDVASGAGPPLATPP